MLEVERIRKDFGKVTAVRDVSFAVPDGLTFGLIGPNGAGKTTTMRMILGI
jgi:ABC-type multidrug transport system ATPase subunit